MPRSLLCFRYSLVIKREAKHETKTSKFITQSATVVSFTFKPTIIITKSQRHKFWCVTSTISLAAADVASFLFFLFFFVNFVYYYYTCFRSIWSLPMWIGLCCTLHMYRTVVKINVWIMRTTINALPETTFETKNQNKIRNNNNKNNSEPNNNDVDRQQQKRNWTLKRDRIER